MAKAADYHPLASPGGSWIFWQSALRNRLAKKTDEGQRYLKVSDFPVEWYNSEHLPLIQLHSLTSPSPPLISHNENIGSEVPLFCCDSFPSGEAKNSKDFGVYHSTYYTPGGSQGCFAPNSTIQ